MSVIIILFLHYFMMSQLKLAKSAALFFLGVLNALLQELCLLQNVMFVWIQPSFSTVLVNLVHRIVLLAMQLLV